MAQAQSAARAMERVAVGYAPAAASLVRACLARLDGDDVTAATLLGSAADGFEREEMAMHAAIARGFRGRLVGGDEGRALTAAMDAWMRGQHVAAPDRFARIFVPGFDNG
jgi:hypothetical protein